MSQSPMQCEKRLYATRVIVHSECRGGNSVERQRPESKEEQKTENWGKAVRSVKVVALDTPVSHHVYSGLRVHLVLCGRVHMSSSGGGSSRFDCGNSHRRISLPAGKKGKDPAGFVVVLFDLRHFNYPVHVGFYPHPISVSRLKNVCVPEHSQMIWRRGIVSLHT